MDYGFIRAACASPALTVADCGSNIQELSRIVHEASEKGVQILVFPELCITGYTCGDLFLQEALMDDAVRSLERLCLLTADTDVLFAAGLPVASGHSRYNAAAFIQRGKVLALIPKTFIPAYGEFYERRWFSPAAQEQLPHEITLSPALAGIPFGTGILLADSRNPLAVVSAEICEDVWVPASPSTKAALAGATVIANLSASNEVVGKAAYRRLLVQAHSAKTVTAYLYADAGHDESTTDMVFAGHNILAANGSIRAESRLFSGGTELTMADLDMEALSQERLRTTTFHDAAAAAEAFRKIPFSLAPSPHAGKGSAVLGGVKKHPFVPEGREERAERCMAVVELQAEGLAKRLRHIHASHAVIGLSGGLDSTLALLVTARAFDKCGIPRSGILSVTMPCFGTTGRTYRNACALAGHTGTTLKEIDIKASVTQHFADIGHDETCRDITYENSQARERTQVLMDLANKTGGIVIGTGDLSELALGWCTYNGDQMSMYGVNSSIPKTLVRHLVAWFADDAAASGSPGLGDVLRDILDTPVSPELLPPSDGGISQKTEELVGPYELHDFFLYHMLRFGFSPRKIFFLARNAFSPAEYDDAAIVKWLRAFYGRFFSQQFKRSCMPDGAKVGTVSLSPRGDWRMPSDASAAAWTRQVAEIEAELGLC